MQSNNDHFDVIVVGAGPSGSLLASQLASMGIRTLLLDKAAFPRLKACGGGIQVRAAAQLQIPFAILRLWGETPLVQTQAPQNVFTKK